MSLPTQTQVLVVGAGPCGLACAITLTCLGLQVTIVDGLAADKEGSRASVVHARTLEVLDTIGLAQMLMDSGIHSKGMAFYAGADKLLEVNMAQLHDETQFPVVLAIPQHEVESIFREKLASKDVEIFRNRTAVGMKEAPIGDGLEVSFEDGAVVRAQYVVGADGSRSTIRRLAGIDFKDPQTGIAYDDHVSGSAAFQLVLADVTFEEPVPALIPLDQPSWHLNNFIVLPLRSTGSSGSNTKPATIWRIGVVVPVGSSVPPRHPGVDELQRMLDERNPWTSKLTIASVTSAPTTYRVRCAVASTFFRRIGGGKVLLVGDAAHVHSPTGGQGMNLGICDAVALGHAIHSHVDASVASAEESDHVLRKYSSSRRGTAIKVIGMTKRLTSVIMASGWRRILRNIVLRIVGCLPPLLRIAAWRLSGLSNRDI